MEQFATEEQQVEAIKKFWKEHGTAIIVGAIVSLGGLWGWRAYSEAQIEKREAASVSYQAALDALEQQSDTSAVKQFVDTSSESGYALLASLTAAAAAVDSADYDQAATHLKRVIEQAENEILISEASLRLARVQIEMNQLDSAMSTLSKVSNASYQAHVDELKGDIYVLQGEFGSAGDAYRSAMEKTENAPLLKMKLDNLALHASANG